MTKSFLVSAALLLCLALVETAILSNITFLPAVPDLVLICSLYLSFLNGRGMGEACGFSAGLFYDFLSGVPFGFNCLLRTLLGYFAGMLGGAVRYTGIVM
ncbi:MAG: rod shape-determining protein MreD, partial [Treponemataceae bacterium]|nr:rod shape-determining protein MreD [Treponemataceae bacterium]